MTRRRKRHAALCLLVLTTAPGFGLLCRGHAPSRFTTVNLPPWERTLPHPVPAHVALHSSPLLLGCFSGSSQSEAKLARTRPDDLLFTIEHPSRSRPSPTGAGRPGLWLLAACSMDSRTAALRAQQDMVAQRLMEAQRGDGYLAAGMGDGRWGQAQVIAHGQNLRGLLAYYAVSHSAAAVYAAMQAGDLVLKHFPHVQTDAGRTANLVAPITLLYQATGEVRYRQWAKKRAQAGLTDGTGLCALYAATGEKHYLGSAQQLWRHDSVRHKDDMNLTEALWSLTGAAGYARALRSGIHPVYSPATGRQRAAT